MARNNSAARRQQRRALASDDVRVELVILGDPPTFSAAVLEDLTRRATGRRRTR